MLVVVTKKNPHKAGCWNWEVALMTVVDACPVVVVAAVFISSARVGVGQGCHEHSCDDGDYRHSHGCSSLYASLKRGRLARSSFAATTEHGP